MNRLLAAYKLFQLHGSGPSRAAYKAILPNQDKKAERAEQAEHTEPTQYKGDEKSIYEERGPIIL